VPVVLVEVGGVARSGHLYGDQTGVAYEYPVRRHSSYVRTGDRFVYQKPGVGYVGCGVLGEIRPSTVSGRLTCDVLSVTMFDAPVSLRDKNGQYYEADPTYWRGKVYWGQGVRPLSSERFEAILAAADVSARQASAPDSAGRSYADSKMAAAVEAYSVQVALGALRARYSQTVTVMPRNNPGFDLRVGPSESPVRYVEVKGTRAADPVFFLSEGERRFSILNADRYTLMVVSGINLASITHGNVRLHDGAIADGPEFELHTTQWHGELRSPTTVPGVQALM
jgi:hypothetical protein